MIYNCFKMYIKILMIFRKRGMKKKIEEEIYKNK